jgi:hypothetical protein
LQQREVTTVAKGGELGKKNSEIDLRGPKSDDAAMGLLA